MNRLTKTAWFLLCLTSWLPRTTSTCSNLPLSRLLPMKHITWKPETRKEVKFSSRFFRQQKEFFFCQVRLSYLDLWRFTTY